MKTTDFEKQIQKDIDKDLSIRINPNATDIAGVYYKDLYIGVAVPPETIKEEIDRGYTDRVGVPYKSIGMALDFINGKLPKYKKTIEEDPSLFVEDKK